MVPAGMPPNKRYKMEDSMKLATVSVNIRHVTAEMVSGMMMETANRVGHRAPKTWKPFRKQLDDHMLRLAGHPVPEECLYVEGKKENGDPVFLVICQHGKVLTEGTDGTPEWVPCKWDTGVVKIVRKEEVVK